MDHLGKYLRNIASRSQNIPLVSVIFPILNNHNNMCKTVESILNQSYTNFELMLITNKNDNSTHELIEQLDDNRIQIILLDENINTAHAYNEGLKNITGNIVMYLDSNNKWDYKYMETMVGAFIKLHDADALYSGQYLYENFDSKPCAACFATYNKPLLHNHNYINLSCFCHRASIINKITEFDESLTTLNDWDFILKISNNFKMYSIPIILTKNYNNQNKNTYNYWDISKKILDKNKIPLKEYPPLNKKISIIIPNYESINELKLCIDSIFSSKSQDLIDIIVVDNNSSENVKKYLLNMKSEGKIDLILNNINYGFSYAINQGINISNKNSDILLLNNDAILTEGSIEHLQNYAYTLPDCGLIGPHEILFEGTNSISENVPYAYNNFECDTTPSKIHHNIINIPLFHDGELLELNFMPFFCTYIKRDIYNKTLGLDSELGRHYRSDRILSDFVRHFLKLKIYQAPHAYVYHKHQVATNNLRKTKKDEYDIMYRKNQWEPNLAKELGYKKPIWED